MPGQWRTRLVVLLGGLRRILGDEGDPAQDHVTQDMEAAADQKLLACRDTLFARSRQAEQPYRAFFLVRAKSKLDGNAGQSEEVARE